MPPFLRASLTLYPAADLSYSTGLASTSRMSLSVQLASMTACRRRWRCYHHWTSRWVVNICYRWAVAKNRKAVRYRISSSCLVPKNQLGKLLVGRCFSRFSFLGGRVTRNRHAVVSSHRKLGHTGYLRYIQHVRFPNGARGFPTEGQRQNGRQIRRDPMRCDRIAGNKN